MKKFDLQKHSIQIGIFVIKIIKIIIFANKTI